MRFTELHGFRFVSVALRREPSGPVDDQSRARASGGSRSTLRRESKRHTVTLGVQVSTERRAKSPTTTIIGRLRKWWRHIRREGKMSSDRREFMKLAGATAAVAGAA